MKKSLLRLRLTCMVMLSILLLSCGTSKQNIKTNLNEIAAVSTAVDSTSTVDVSNSQVAKTTQDSSLREAEVVHTVDITLSAPDSSGKQYPLRITESFKYKGRTINVGSVSLQVKNDNLSTSKTASSRAASKASKKETIRSEIIKKPPSAFLTITVLLVIAVIFLLILYRTPFVNCLNRIKTLFKFQ